MGFKIYRTAPEGEHAWRLTQGEPLRFSGPSGLIARWYRSRAAEIGDRPWLAPAAVWLDLASGPGGEGGRWIVLEQFSEDTPRCARLEAINGLFGWTTRLMFRFRPLEQVPGVPGRVVREPDFVCGWGEELSIDGGSGSTGCTWRWITPKLGFASVVAGGGGTASGPAGAVSA